MPRNHTKPTELLAWQLVVAATPTDVLSAVIIKEKKETHTIKGTMRTGGCARARTHTYTQRCSHNLG